MRYLITGGCGFIGSNLAAEVLKRGEELAVFDNLSRTGSVSNLEWLRQQGDFQFCHGDIRSCHDVEKSVREFKPDVLFHLAGQVAMTTSVAHPRLDFEVNAMGTLNVLESIRKNRPDCTVVYSSTNKVYGDLEWISYEEKATRHSAPDYPNGFDESLPLDFRSPYGCSKGSADQYMLDYARMFGLKTVVFRHSSMYGGRQYATYDQGWIGWFCQKALEARQAKKSGKPPDPFTISGDGKQVRDALHADDVTRLYFSAIDNIKNVTGKAFNIGGGMENSLSLLELFGMLEDMPDVKLVYKKLPPRSSDQKVFVANNGLIGSLTGWRPLVSARDGIDKAVRWQEGISELR